MAITLNVKTVQEYCKRSNDCNTQLINVKEDNKALGEIVKRHIIIDND